MKQLNLLDMSSSTTEAVAAAPLEPQNPHGPQSSRSREQPYSVSQLNELIRNRLENSFTQVWLRGEVSNFVRHSSGHLYFSLKDEKAELRAVMFRGSASKLKLLPKNGMECQVKGQVTLYPARGSTQIVCTYIEPLGHGALQVAFEQLKNKLQQEALFERAQVLPKFVRRIAVISSPTGAAIQDFLKVLKRRNPLTPVLLVPSRVQGQAAVDDLLQAIAQVQQLPDVDVLVMTRGGGSIEDLWCFNDERVARALAASSKIVISAVGHEIDYTICDFIADHRAPTPSAAAEILVPEREHLQHKLGQLQNQLQIQLQHLLGQGQQQVQALQSRLNAYKPLRRVQDFMQRRDELTHNLERNTGRHLKNLSQHLNGLQDRLQQVLQRSLLVAQHDWQHLNSRLSALNPACILQRGFSVVQKKGRVITNTQQLQAGDHIAVQLAQGHLDACITKVHKPVVKSP